MVNAENVTDYIIDFENGDISVEMTLELFSYLIKSGLAWQLQGSYGRSAMGLIDSNIIDSTGKINWTKIHEKEIC